MIPVVLSGGSGTRLWPLSRSQYPKQFCELMTESLLAQTLRRLSFFGQPWVLTLAEMGHLTRRVFSERSIPTERILLEPSARNTAPAIALLCRLFELQGAADEIVGVFPADHLIEKDAAFRSAVQLAVASAERGAIVTLGIHPTYAATGFGYIELGSEERGSANAPLPLPGGSARSVLGFREKPDAITAESYVKSGRFFWNAGIFIFKISAMSDAFRKHAPEIWGPLMELRPDLTNLTEIYSRLPSISIDYAVMEKASEQVCVPCDIGWSDLGSWDDVAELSHPVDPAAHPVAQHGQSVAHLRNRAEVASTRSENCIGFSTDNKVMAFVGLKDVMAIDTPDALLVMKRGESQHVRDIVKELEKRRHKSLNEHLFEVRPWGRYEILSDEGHYKLKKIIVDPHAQISYQSHSRRSEQWFIISGQGEVIIDDSKIPVERGSSVFIPVGAKHRVRNTGETPLEFVEVQIGTYFGEDDIVRYQDDYNRR